MKLCAVLVSLNTIFAIGVEGANIMMLLYLGSKSHKNTFWPLAKGLAEKGHQVTLITPFPKSEDVKGITEVNPKLLVQGVPRILKEHFQGKDSIIGFMFDLSNVAIELCPLLLESPETQALLKRKGEFDLMLIDGLLNDCALGLAVYLQVPYGYINTGSFFPWQASSTGNPSPSSYIPCNLLPFSDSMSFWERLINFFINNIWNMIRFCHTLPQEDTIAKKFLGNDLPPLSEIEKNVSLILTNQHFALEMPKPYLPALIDVGGMHCHAPKPLPEDLLKFVEGSGKDGFIYFSFGTVVVGSQIDPRLRKAFLDVFSRLPQRVLWKWETETMEGEEVPPNIKLSKWLPQQDLLGHPKCRLFITHGGLLGQQEAIFHGVPMLVIPFFGDQHGNGIRAESRGIALCLKAETITSQTLLEAMKRLLNEPQFHMNIEQNSRINRDQPEAPLERAIFWTEYVIRHKGAPHLRSSARLMPWYQYYLFDVIGFICIVTLIILTTVYLILRKIYRMTFGAKNVQKPKRE